MKNRPFAVIGVNVAGHDAKELKTVVEKEKLGWRLFADPGDWNPGGIAARWNLSATPTRSLIDHKGVIRHKWLGSLGEPAIDTALKSLIEEAEGSGRSSP